MRHPLAPTAARMIGDADMRLGEERVAPVSDSAGLGIAAEFGVTFAHQPKGVLVEAEPDMQPVLLDAVRSPAPRGALAAEPPAKLIDAHLVGPAMLGPGQFERRRHRRASAADHHHFDWPRRRHGDISSPQRPPSRAARAEPRTIFLLSPAPPAAAPVPSHAPDRLPPPQGRGSASRRECAPAPHRRRAD